MPTAASLTHERNPLMLYRSRTYFRRLRFVLITCFTVGNAFMSQASASQSESVRQTYLPSDFAQFAPRSALDLVQQVPGFSIEEGGGDRGFGQADTNVLINGRRISGKSNGPKRALQRLSLDSVVRLEVLDGASLDIGGLSGQVVNVITVSKSHISGRYRYKPRARPTGNSSEARFREFTVALTGGSNKSEWTLSVDNKNSAFSDSGYEVVSDPIGTVTDMRFEKSRRLFDKPSLSGSYSTETKSGAVFNLIAELNGNYTQRSEKSERLTGSREANTRLLKQSEDEYNFEIGTDYDFALGEGRLKLLGLHRFASNPTTDRTSVSYLNSIADGSVFRRQANQAESILRAEFAFSAFDSQWRWSLEGTENYLDIDSQLDNLDAQGVLSPVDFDGASARVEETRAESTLNVSKRLSEQVTFQATLGAEYSEIRQTGSSDVTRDFVRPKGFVAINYRPTDILFLSAKLERLVDQLTFSSFIASVDVNLERTNGSNIDLVPPQMWNFEVEAQQSVGNIGNVTLKLWYNDIEDIVDQIPIESGGQAFGNIDRAKRYGGFLKSTFLGDSISWEGARADVQFGYGNSEVTDPILGSTRKISREWYKHYKIAIRQDFLNTSWALGASIDYSELAPDVRIDEVSFYNKTRGTFDVYLENKNVNGLTVRATIENVLGAENRFRRTVYADRLANEILFSERFSRSFGFAYTLTIEGSF